MSRGETWFDEAAGPLVRPYAVTRGRTRGGQADLQMITLVIALQRLTSALSAQLDPEHAQIMSFCQHPKSVAEISAEVHLPLSVVKILIGDLIERRLVTFRSAVTPDLQVLQAVINGIRQL
ncbi:MAG: hypothetical protein QG622_3110 [Actinomycetota bacterium]|nr:hypothetical protein [Actinomycetota bacterium]